MNIKVGKVLKAQGIKGELKLSCLLDSPKMLMQVKQLYLSNNLHNVSKIRSDGTFVFVQFSDILDRNTAELYRGWDVYCEKSLLQLPNGSYFVDDVIGCRVVLNDGNDVGEVVDILQYGAADVYVCKGKMGEVSFPALKDLLISVDVDEKKIVLDKNRFEEVYVVNED